MSRRRASEVVDLSHGFYRILLHYGFMDEVDIPAELATITAAGEPFKPMETSYFLARQTLIPSSRPGMAIWRERCSPRWCAIPKARWSSSSCRRTG